MKLSKGVHLYIVMRRQEGCRFVTGASVLLAFANFMGDIQLHEVTTKQILAFLSSKGVSVRAWRRKHSGLRRFFRHWFLIGVTCEIRMPENRAAIRTTFTPYVYSNAELRLLIHACETMPMNARSIVDARTARTVILLLYSTGARMREALALLESDVDLGAGTLRLSSEEPDSVRTIPIGIEVQSLLLEYVEWKKLHGRRGAFFFPDHQGKQIRGTLIYTRFQKMLTITGCTRRDSEKSSLRLSDFRATFAARQLTSWIRQGKDLDRLYPALCAYMGYAGLDVAQQLLDVTPERFKKELNALSPTTGKGWAADEELMRLLPTL